MRGLFPLGLALLCVPFLGCNRPQVKPARAEPGPAALPSTMAPTAAAPPITAAPAMASASPPPLAAPSTTVMTAPSAHATAADGCPPEMAHIGRYCIDRWEATLVELDDRGEKRPHPHYEVPDPQSHYAARSRAGDFPQGHISRVVAAAACSAADKRLCTLREWHRACSGPQVLTYPYGWEGERGTCNTAKPHLLGRLFGNDPRAWKYDEQFNSPVLLREPGFLARTGEYARCISTDGVYDLVGNLHEWVADRVDYDLPQKIQLIADIERKIDKNFGHGIFMGGFFSTTSEHGRGCLFLTPGHEPRYHDYSTGFRCCRDAE